MSRTTTGVIILAGGSSSRLGKPKQLLVYQGKTLLRYTAEMALALDCGPVIIVTGALHQELIDTCGGLPVTFAHNENWQQGMATSITTGLQTLEAMRPDNADSVMLMLCDQPLIALAHLRDLLDVFDTAPFIVATGYNGIVGVPAVFSRALFQELYQLKGDKGARALFSQRQDKLRRVVFEDAAVDVDRVEDWEGLGKP